MMPSVAMLWEAQGREGRCTLRPMLHCHTRVPFFLQQMYVNNSYSLRCETDLGCFDIPDIAVDCLTTNETDNRPHTQPERAH